jgi:hypothetical protein
MATAKKPTTQQQRAAAAAEIFAARVSTTKAKRALDKAEADQKALRKKYRHLFPENEAIVFPGLGEIRRRVTRPTTPPFSFAKYLERHGEPTKRMEPFIGEPPAPYDVWDVKE